ncbi:2'-5' RNA ligase family protein [Arthrobacter sp. D1-29]
MQHFIAVIPPSRVSDTLREVGNYLMVGPHITVKAQPGLNAEDKPKWMGRLRQSLVHFGEVKVQLGSLASFGGSVAYLEVDSPRIYDLYDALLTSINPAPEDAERYFELDGWTPHLTLEQGRSIDFDKLRAAVDRLGRVSAFTVDTLWVCRQDHPGQPYYPETPINLV